MTTKEVIQMTGYSRQKIWKEQSRSNFPKKIGRNEYSKSAIIQWQKNLIAMLGVDDMNICIKEADRKADEALLAHLMLHIATVRHRLSI